MRLADKLPVLVFMLFTIASCLTQGASAPNALGEDPDIDLEGMLIDDGPTNGTSSTGSAFPSMSFTSALEIQPPHPMSMAPTSVSSVSPASPTSPSISKSNGTSPPITAIGIDPVAPAQTGLPSPVRGSSSEKLHPITSYKMLGLMTCLGAVWASVANGFF
ncbi:hypothetical protein PSTG_14202 [Puccinia striiformis f. sp. tritici PST-78]|uniref:Uncharacterized protein n=1 Tax=Puccinia striiformis f. sp. tritici PST-78 TaxID=1165861 RepID=A0A0L0UZK0_9BASI|nr:hypothetical protein PSTG_14202 [Puccinia striiformis f. sp. tritici PST-78]